MISADYDKLLELCKKRNYHPLGILALIRVLNEATIYKFKLQNRGSYQYAVVMDGYGVPPKTDRWSNVTTIGHKAAFNL